MIVNSNEIHSTRKTDKTITAMPYESGFPSPKSLNRLFKIEYNCSPSEYKKRNTDRDRYLISSAPTGLDKKEAIDNLIFSRSNMSKINIIDEWTELVKEFIKKCIDRYGIEELTTWYFEVWNPQNVEYVFWNDGIRICLC